MTTGCFRGVATLLVLVLGFGDVESFVAPLSSKASSRLVLSAASFPKIDADSLGLDVSKLPKFDTDKLSVDQYKIDANALKEKLAQDVGGEVSGAMEKLKAADLKDIVGTVKVDPTAVMSEERIADAQTKLGILKSNWETQTAGIKDLVDSGGGSADVKAGIKDLASNIKLEGDTADKLKLMKENFSKMSSGGVKLEVGGDVQEKLTLMKENLSKKGDLGDVRGGLGNVMDKVKGAVESTTENAADTSSVDSAAGAGSTALDNSVSMAVPSIKAAAADFADSVTSALVANAADDSILDGSVVAGHAHHALDISSLDLATSLTDNAPVGPAVAAVIVVAAFKLFKGTTVQ